MRDEGWGRTPGALPLAKPIDCPILSEIQQPPYGERNSPRLLHTAGFSAGAGAKAKGIGYENERASTLKGGARGFQMPTVLKVSCVATGQSNTEILDNRSPTLVAGHGSHISHVKKPPYRFMTKRLVAVVVGRQEKVMVRSMGWVSEKKVPQLPP